MYLTQEPKYGEYYAESIKEKGDGTFSLLLCWVLLGKPYAVTKVCRVDYVCLCDVGLFNVGHVNIIATTGKPAYPRLLITLLSGRE